MVPDSVEPEYNHKRNPTCIQPHTSFVVFINGIGIIHLCTCTEKGKQSFSLTCVAQQEKG